MKITVNVTQEDIDLGCKNDSDGVHGGCMVWRAFQRCTEGAFPVIIVDHCGIDIYPSLEAKAHGCDYRYVAFPDELGEIDVGERISAFDDGLPVEPFSFELDLPLEPTS